MIIILKKDVCIDGIANVSALHFLFKIAIISKLCYRRNKSLRTFSGSEYYKVKTWEQNNMKKLFDEYSQNIETNIILSAAVKNGWDIQILSQDPGPLAQITKNGLKYRIYKGGISVNVGSASLISGDKFFTNTMLKTQIQYATDAAVYMIDDLDQRLQKKLLEKHLKLVTKPLDQNNGIGVTPGITSQQHFQMSLNKLRELGCKKVLVEKHVETINEYRIIMWKGTTVDVLKRIPAYVVADGIMNIQELIEAKNKLKSDQFGGVVKPISLDSDLDTLLMSKQMSRSTVLPLDTHCSVESTCNLAQGGEVQRIELDKVHPEYLEVFKKVHELTWLNYCGIDLITYDITKPPLVGATVINEINSAPSISVAFYDDVVTNRPFLGMTKVLEQMETDPFQVLSY